MIKKTLLLLATSASLASLATQADAQTKYYSRQILTGMKGSSTPAVPTYTYVPTYGTYGSCTATAGGDGTTGTQTASITKCTRNDGTVVNNSLCTPATITKSCDPRPTPTCATLVTHQAPVSASGSYSVGTYANSVAQSACNSYIASNGLKGTFVCYNLLNTQATTLYISSSTAYYNNSYAYASVCK